MAAPIDTSDALIPISVPAFDAIVFTFFSFAAVTTIARVYLWTYVLRCGVLGNVLVSIGTLMTLAITLLGHFEVVEVNELVQSTPMTAVPGQMDPGFLRHFNLVYRYGEIAQLIYLLALPVIKCAILAFYRKIVVTRRSTYLLYAFALIIMGQGIGNFIASLYNGLRNGSIWNFLDQGFRDPVNTNHQIVNSSFQIVFDVILLLIPLPVIRKLKIRSSAKVGLLVIYSISFVSLVATAMRLYKVTNFFYTAGPNTGAVKAELSYWSLIELNTAIFCANLPALSSLLRFARGQIGTSAERKFSFTRASDAHGRRLRKASDDNNCTLSSDRQGRCRFWPLSALRSSYDTEDGESIDNSEKISGLDFSPHKYGNGEDEHSHRVQIFAGGRSSVGDSFRFPSTDEQNRGDKYLASVSVSVEAQPPPVDEIHKTYEFSAIAEKGIAL